MKTIRAYEADDGTVHTSKKKAKAADKNAAIKRWVAENKIGFGISWSMYDASMVARDIIENLDSLKEILKSFEDAEVGGSIGYD